MQNRFRVLVSTGLFSGLLCVSAQAGVWSEPFTPGLPAGATFIVFNDISCIDSNNCMAVGYDNAHPIALEKVDGVWQSVVEYPISQAGTRFNGVSCNAGVAKTCVAVGDGLSGPFAAVSTNGVWAAPTTFPDRPAPYTLTAVDCFDANNCTAVGTANDQPLYTVLAAGVWSAPSTIVGPGASAFSDVNCSDAATCTAVGTATLMDGSKEPFYANRVAGTFDLSTVPVALPNGIGGDLQALDCEDALNCTAVGLASNTRPIYVTKTAGVWATGAFVNLPANPTPYSGAFNSISCTDATNCTAVGYVGVGADPATRRAMYARLTAGAWDATATLLGGDVSATLEAVSCSHPGNCTAVGATPGSNLGFIVTETNPLTITATSDTVILGAPLPPIVAAYNGFITGEGEANLTTPPTCTTTATASSPIGTYDTTCSGAVAPNYSITYVSGTINIVPPPQAPAFTSAASTTFTVGTTGTFQVTGTGEPAPTFEVTSGLLPGGVTLSDAGVLSGKPNAGTAGTYNFTITASNGELPDATQAFTLTVNDAPAGGGTNGGCNNAMGGISGSEIPIALMMIALGIGMRLRKKRQPAYSRRS